MVTIRINNAYLTFIRLSDYLVISDYLCTEVRLSLEEQAGVVMPVHSSVGEGGGGGLRGAFLIDGGGGGGGLAVGLGLTQSFVKTHHRVGTRSYHFSLDFATRR